MNEGIKLTSFSHGAGGCKLSPKVLTTILESNSPKMEDTVF
jgi:selenide,water dikinase